MASYFCRTFFVLLAILVAYSLIENAQVRGGTFPRHEVASFSCYQPPELDPTILPTEVLPVLDQNQVNCFAWQEFLSLNWVASPDERGKPHKSEQFGRPGGLRPLVWQTYKSVTEVFLPGAAVPVPWEQRGDLWERCRSLVTQEQANLPILQETNEAGIAPPSWLVGQNERKIFFEIYINRDMFEFIREKKFYNAQSQYAAVQVGGPGINAPAGKTRYGEEGAIEIKAAWIEIEDPRLWPRFKVSEAIVYDAEVSPQCRKVRVGLVGLHIIHKTPSARQWTWATFEHIDNAPDRTAVCSQQFHPYYTFYNPSCSSNTSFTKCEENKKPECDATGSHCTPFHPIQVVRETPLSPQVKELNARVHQLIRAADSDSVWQYYDLVNVMWPASSKRNPPGATVPLTQGGMHPTILANTVIETYVQTGTAQKNCLDCHQLATIAPTVKNRFPLWGADYSFVLRRACDPAVAPGQCHP